MTLLHTLKRNLATRWGYTPAKAGHPHAPPWALASADRARFSLPDGALAAHQAELYQRLSWVQGAVNLISSSVASYRLGVKRRQGEDTREIRNHPFERRLEDPNPLLVDFELIEYTTNWLALTGNAYWWLNAPSSQDTPTEIWLIRPDKLTPVPDGQLYLKGYEYRDGGYSTLLPPHEIVHFRRFHPRSDFVGLSPVEALATVAVGDMKMQEWNTNFFAQENAKMPVMLAFASHIPDAQWEQMKAEFKRDFGGAKRGLPLLRGAGREGVSAIPVGIPQKDMEFIAGRQWNKEEILFMYGVHPGLLDPNVTYANATIARASFAEFTLWPMMQRIARAITKQVLPRYGEGLVAAFDDPRISDLSLELDQINVRKDYWTIDELRALENKEPMGDGRGGLRVAEANALAGVGGSAPEPAPSPNGAGPVDKAASDDLRRWRKKALRVLDETGLAVCAFDSDCLPAAVQNHVALGLADAKDAEAVKAVFEGVQVGAAARLGDDAAHRLASAVERAADALEIR